VIAAGENDDGGVGDFIHEPVFIVEAAGPTTREFVLERFGFADAAERVAQGFANQPGQPLEEFGGRAWPSCYNPGRLRRER
jgi:hypothetical protein